MRGDRLDFGGVWADIGYELHLTDYRDYATDTIVGHVVAVSISAWY